MRLVVWNVRGLDKAYKQAELKKFLQKNKIGLLALFKHRVWGQFANSILRRLANTWQWCDNHNTSRGRIWLIWDPNEVEVTVIDIHPHFIESNVRVKTLNLVFTLTTVYGLHTMLIDDHYGWN